MKYKTKTKKHLVGGIKQKNLSLTSWQAVYKMTCVQGATLTAISYSSVEGFIFKLDIPHDIKDAEFDGLNKDGTAFNQPIYSLIFKIAIISQTRRDKLRTPLIIYESLKPTTFPKEMPTLQEFINEAYTQQNIYNTTLYPAGRPITIGVVDFSYFDSKSSKILINKLKSLQRVNGDIVESMLNYLHSQISGDRMLGLITMDLVNSDFIKLYEVEERTRDTNIINSDYNYAIAEILILFTKVGIINRDCHAGNIMASTNPPSRENENEIRTLLIDFGRILRLDGATYTQMEDQIRETFESEYVGKMTYETYKTNLKELHFTHLYSYGTPEDDDAVINIMHNIIKFIAYIDYIVKIIKNPNTSRDYPQMLDILKYLYGADVTNFRDNWKYYLNNLPNESIAKYKAIIPIIKRLTEDPQKPRNLLSKNAIEQNIETERIFSISRETDSFNQFDQSLSEWIPISKTIVETNGMRKRKGPEIYNNNTNDDCDKPCDPEDDPNDGCCRRITNNFKKFFRIGGKTKHKNKHNRKFHKTRKQNKRT